MQSAAVVLRDTFQYSRILVHPALLEDQHQEDVRRYKCRNRAHPAMGYDWDLDNQVWVR